MSSPLLRIFDVDGVLVESAYANFISLERVAKEFGFVISYEEDKRLHAIPTTKKLEYLETKYNRKLSGAERVEFIHRKFEYLKQVFSEVKINPYARDTIAAFHTRGDIITLASNARTEYLEIVINLLGIDDYISSYLGNNSGFAAKPKPDMFIHLTRKYGKMFSNCHIYEDTPENVEIAAQMGYKFTIIKHFEDLRGVI